MIKPIDVPVANLRLDIANPRFETEQENQRDDIRQMAEDQSDKLLNLAEDVVAFGLDPSSLAIVIRDEANPERYITVEGNRRLAALKVLHNPDLVKGVWTANRESHLKKLSEAFHAEAITQVPCVVMPDRDAAN